MSSSPPPLSPSGYHAEPTSYEPTPLLPSDQQTTPAASSSTPRRPANRSNSLNIPSLPGFLRTSSSSNASPVLPAPVTAPIGQGGVDEDGPVNTGPRRRDRAHTVSVTLRNNRPRGESLSQAQGDKPTGRRRGESLVRRSQDSDGRRRSGSVREPVDFDIGTHEGELHDEVVGMLDCIDPQVSTGVLPRASLRLVDMTDP
jgi:hypothetical protein